MKKRIRDIAIILAITVLGLLVLEGVARLTGAQPAKPLLSPWMQYDRDLLWKIRPNSYGTKGSRFSPTISFLHNRFGFRMQDIEKKKPDGVYRVAVLGDSNIWGFGVEQAQAACSILQERFDETPVDSRNVEVLNMGIIGYSSYQGKVFLETAALDFDPDLIILCYNYNDRRYVAGLRQRDSKAYFASQARTAQWFEAVFGNSAFLTWFAPPVGKPQQTTYYVAKPRVSLYDYLANFDTMLKECKSHRIPAIVLALSDNRYELHRIDRARKLAGLTGSRYAKAEQEDQASTVSKEDIEKAIQILKDALNHLNLSDATIAPVVLQKIIEMYPDTALGALGYEENIQKVLFDFKSQVGSIVLTVDSVMGMTPIVPDWVYTEMLKSHLARKNPNTRFIDFREPFEDMDLDEIRTYFLPNDPCHMTPKGQKLLADTLESVIRDYPLLN